MGDRHRHRGIRRPDLAALPALSHGSLVAYSAHDPRGGDVVSGFQPTCPSCWMLCPVGSRYCAECGVYLYLTDDELRDLCRSHTTNSHPASDDKPVDVYATQFY